MRPAKFVWCELAWGLLAVGVSRTNGNFAVRTWFHKVRGYSLKFIGAGFWAGECLYSFYKVHEDSINTPSLPLIKLAFSSLELFTRDFLDLPTSRASKAELGGRKIYTM